MQEWIISAGAEKLQGHFECSFIEIGAVILQLLFLTVLSPRGREVGHLGFSSQLPRGDSHLADEE